MKKRLLAIGIAAVLGVNIAGTSAVWAADKVEITNVSYNPTRELQEIIVIVHPMKIFLKNMQMFLTWMLILWPLTTLADGTRHRKLTLQMVVYSIRFMKSKEESCRYKILPWRQQDRYTRGASSNNNRLIYVFEMWNKFILHIQFFHCRSYNGFFHIIHIL